MKFVLLDRDGVINFDSDDYIRSVDVWLPIPGSIEAIASLSRAGFEVVVVTNQSGLSRGFFGLDELEAMHAKMRALVEAQGGSRQQQRKEDPATRGHGSDVTIRYASLREMPSAWTRWCTASFRKTTATAASRGPACWTPSSRITVVPWQAASWWETP